MRKMADILRARGQLDEALAEYLENPRPSVYGGDTDGQAHALYRAAGVCLAQVSTPSSFRRENGRTLLADALRLSLDVRRVVAIVAIASELARLMAEAAVRREALDLLHSLVTQSQSAGAEEAAALLLQARDALPLDESAA